jgi:hypothetical protein
MPIRSTSTAPTASDRSRAALHVTSKSVNTRPRTCSGIELCSAELNTTMPAEVYSPFDEQDRQGDRNRVDSRELWRRILQFQGGVLRGGAAGDSGPSAMSGAILTGGRLIRSAVAG